MSINALNRKLRLVIQILLFVNINSITNGNSNLNKITIRKWKTDADTVKNKVPVSHFVNVWRYQISFILSHYSLLSLLD